MKKEKDILYKYDNLKSMLHWSCVDVYDIKRWKNNEIKCLYMCKKNRFKIGIRKIIRSSSLSSY